MIVMNNLSPISLNKFIMEEEIIQCSIACGDWLNYIIAVFLALITIRDLIISNTNKDYSKSNNWFTRTFLSRKETITAERIAREFGFSSTNDVNNAINTYKKEHIASDMPQTLIKLLSKCIIKSDSGYFQFNGHKSAYYVDTMGKATDKYNCIEMRKAIEYLIHNRKKGKERKYDYIFSTKGGNISLVSSFVTDNNKISIVAKDEGEVVDSGDVTNLSDSIINYEGLNTLIDYAQKEGRKEIKGIAIACNLANGSTLRQAIIKFNNTIKELQNNSVIALSIQPIENIFILYRAIDEEGFDHKFNIEKLTCYRFFDLNENSKKTLYEIQTNPDKIKDFRCYKCINNNNKKKKKMCNAQNCINQ